MALPAPAQAAQGNMGVRGYPFGHLAMRDAARGVAMTREWVSSSTVVPATYLSANTISRWDDAHHP